MLASASPCSFGGCGAAFGFHGDAGLLGVGDVFDALTLDLGAFEDGGDELLLVTEDFGLLHLDLLLLLDLLDLDLFGDDLLLHDVGLELVGFVGLGLLAACGFGELGLLDVEVALGLGLFGERERFGEDALLVGGGLGDGGFAQSYGAADGGVALGFGGGDLGVALDAGDVGTAHVGDVFVLVADLADGEAR